MNKIIWLSKSLKHLRKIDRQDNAGIRNAVGELAAMPQCQNVKALTNHEYGYRLRVGRYRVLFDWEETVKIVEIQEVRKRMNTHTNIQIINGIDGAPAFVVMPYTEWIAQRDREQAGVPHEVVSLVFDNEWTPIRAWREYLMLTQAEVARKIGVSQAAYAQSEIAAKPRKSTLKKIATAMNLTLEQIDF